MKLVIDENNIVKSIWSGPTYGIKKKKNLSIVEAPSDWCGNIGDCIDEFEEDWSPKEEYLKKIHKEEREQQLRHSVEHRQRRAVQELKKLYEKECRIRDRLDSEDDPRAKEKCEKWLRRIEREINAIYSTGFHINLDEPIEEQLNLDVNSEVFAKDDDGYWTSRRLAYNEKVDGESIVKKNSLSEEELSSYQEAVSRDSEVKRIKNMSKEEKEQEKEQELDSLADTIAREERKAQIRSKDYDAEKEFERRSKKIEEKYALD